MPTTAAVKLTNFKRVCNLRFNEVGLNLDLQPPHHYAHLTITATSLLWPPHYYGHLLRPPHYYIHLIVMATSLLRPHHYYNHLTITATSLLRPPYHYGNHCSIQKDFPYEKKKRMSVPIIRSVTSAVKVTFIQSPSESILL